MGQHFPTAGAAPSSHRPAPAISSTAALEQAAPEPHQLQQACTTYRRAQAVCEDEELSTASL